MKAMTAGVTKAGKGIDNLTWNILGQTYVPKALTRKRVLLARAAPARHLRAAAHSRQPGRVHLRARGQVRSDPRRQGGDRHGRRVHPAADADHARAVGRPGEGRQPPDPPAYVPRGQHSMAAAALRRAFPQPDQATASTTWRQLADQLRPRWPKLVTPTKRERAGCPRLSGFSGPAPRQTAQH